MSYLGPQNATITVVPGTTTSVTLFSETAKSSGRTIYNNSAGSLYVAFGTVATAGSCTTVIASGATNALPVPIYAGQVTGVWASAGTAMTTWW